MVCQHVQTAAVCHFPLARSDMLVLLLPNSWSGARVVCLGFSEAHWVQLQPIVQALRAQQHLTILRDELHPLQEALTAPDLREDIRGSAEQRPVRRQVPTILVLPERVRPGGLGHILRRLQQQRQHQQQQEVLQRVPAPAAAPGGDSSVVDCACSSGSIQQRKGGGSTEQQQRQQVGVEMTPWSLLAAPVGVFYEGYGEGVLTAVHVQQKVDSFIVDCQLHRRGELRSTRWIRRAVRCMAFGCFGSKGNRHLSACEPRVH